MSSLEHCIIMMVWMIWLINSKTNKQNSPQKTIKKKKGYWVMTRRIRDFMATVQRLTELQGWKTNAFLSLVLYTLCHSGNTGNQQWAHF